MKWCFKLFFIFCLFYRKKNSCKRLDNVDVFILLRFMFYVRKEVVLIEFDYY